MNRIKIIFTNDEKREVPIHRETIQCVGGFNKKAKNGHNDLCIIKYKDLRFGETIPIKYNDVRQDKYVVGIDWKYRNSLPAHIFSDNIIEVGGDLTYVEPLCKDQTDTDITVPTTCIVIPGGKSETTEGDSGKFGYYQITNLLMV